MCAADAGEQRPGLRRCGTARASTVAGSTARSPNRAIRSGWPGQRSTGPSTSPASSSKPRTSGPNSRRQAGPSAPRPAQVSSSERTSTPAPTVVERVRQVDLGGQPPDAGRARPAAARPGTASRRRSGGRPSSRRAAGRAGSAPRCGCRRRSCPSPSSTVTDRPGLGQRDRGGQPVGTGADDDARPRGSRSCGRRGRGHVHRDVVVGRLAVHHVLDLDVPAARARRSRRRRSGSAGCLLVERLRLQHHDPHLARLEVAALLERRRCSCSLCRWPSPKFQPSAVPATISPSITKYVLVPGAARARDQREQRPAVGVQARQALPRCMVSATCVRAVDLLQLLVRHQRRLDQMCASILSTAARGSTTAGGPVAGVVAHRGQEGDLAREQVADHDGPATTSISATTGSGCTRSPVGRRRGRRTGTGCPRIMKTFHSSGTPIGNVLTGC